MNAELREAAERYRKLGTESSIITDHAGNPTGFVRVPGGRWDEVTDLADAYLAEHPADDADDITEDWLREIGFTTPEGYSEWTLANGKVETRRIYIDTDKPEDRDWYVVDGKWPVVVPCVLQPKTRGDVRRLLACLGITASEGKE